MSRIGSGSPGALRGLLAVAGVGGLLLASACGPTQNAAVSDEPSASASASRSGTTITGSGTVDLGPDGAVMANAGGSTVKQGKLGALPPCNPVGGHTRNVCVNVGTGTSSLNTTHVFTAPGAVSVGAWNVNGAPYFDHGELDGGPNSPWTLTAGTSDVGGLMNGVSKGMGSVSFYTNYAASGDLPTDTVRLHFEDAILVDNNCSATGGTYVTAGCGIPPLGRTVTATAGISNTLLLIGIQNNLSSSSGSDKTLTLNGTGFVLSNMAQSTAGTNAQSISPTATGYFGAYLNVNSGPRTFSATYTLPDDTATSSPTPKNQLAGTTFRIDASITTLGTFDPAGTTCTVNKGSSTDAAANCSLNVTSQPGVMQLNVDLTV